MAVRRATFNTVLHSLVKERLGDAVVIICDPAAVAQLREQHPGDADVALTIGRGPLEEPLPVRLLSESDGGFALENPLSPLAAMVGAKSVEMGPCAVVLHAASGVRILLTSLKTPPFDLGVLRSQGIQPEQCDVIGTDTSIIERRPHSFS